MTQEVLAKKTGISVSYLSLIEQNKRNISVAMLEAIAKTLAIPPSILLFLAAEKKELTGMDSGLIEKLSRTALDLMDEKRAKK